jgi:hypothetical protein
MGNIFGKIATLRSSAEITAAGVEVGSWCDCDQFHEVIFALNVTAFAARNNETLDVIIERWSPNTNGYTTVVAFTQIAGTGAASEEKLVHMSVSPYIFGGRVRARCTTAGNWSSKSITYEVKAYFKA